MTIPYNASRQSMVEYLTGSLVEIVLDKKDSYEEGKNLDSDNLVNSVSERSDQIVLTTIDTPSASANTYKKDKCY